MFRVLGLIAVAAVMFTAAAAGSWWWRQQAAAAPPPAADATAAPPAATEATDSAGPKNPGLPVAARPRPMSVEELLRYGLSLNAREESLRQREDEFRRRETQLQLALADLHNEQAVVDGLRGQIQEQLQAADALLARIQQGRQDLAAEQARAKAQLEEFKSAQFEMDDQERENVKRLATWLRAMEPANAAEVLKEMANDGRMATAVKMLSHLEEREAAKILDALSDSALIDGFIQEYQKLKTPLKRSARR
jgi:septal ring factor EnvC (AmiA/AmiB activator)